MEPIEQQQKPWSIWTPAPMTLLTLVSAGALAFLVYATISWRPYHHLRESASTAEPPKTAQKVSGVIQASVTPKNNVEDQRPIDLTGSAVVTRSLDEIHYKWILPDDVQHLGGDLSGTVVNVEAGEVIATDLKVRGRTPGPKKVFFRVYVGDEVQSSGHTAVFLTEEYEASADTDAVTAQKLGPVKRGKAVKAHRSVEEFRRRAIR